MEDVLDVPFGAQAGDGNPGGLSLRADDGEVSADERVEERGLADVGCPGEGDVSGARHGPEYRGKTNARCLDEAPGVQEAAGDGLLSHHLSVAVPSALQGLTAVFGMGTG